MRELICNAFNESFGLRTVAERQLGARRMRFSQQCVNRIGPLAWRARNQFGGRIMAANAAAAAGSSSQRVRRLTPQQSICAGQVTAVVH
jgi:hypothetical protein